MDKNKYENVRLRMERTAEALRKNNFLAECVDSREEALEVASNFLCDGMTVAVGGSMTLSEIGIYDILKSGRFNYLDRYANDLDAESIRRIYTSTFASDAFLCSSNAVTENGELVNVDGTGNRVAAMIYGPKSVIVIVGFNKIVKDVDSAIERIKNTAAPANAIRLKRATPCTKTGVCCNCESPDRICCDTVVMGWQRTKDRVKVILVGEELGY